MHLELQSIAAQAAVIRARNYCRKLKCEVTGLVKYRRLLLFEGRQARLKDLYR